MMDLLCLYLVNVLRPVFETPKGSRAGGGDEDEEDEEDQGRTRGDEKQGCGHGGQLSGDDEGPDGGELDRGRARKRDRRRGGGRAARRRGSSSRSESRRKNVCLKDIELLDMNGPKLIHGLRSWFVVYQIIGQLNWMGKPLYLSILYKAILIPTCVYIVWRDFLEPIMSAFNITDQFKNPIFVFISLGAAVTLLLQAILTIYNNLFNLCPLFKVLTTRRLCFVREDVQHIVGSQTMPGMMIFFAVNTLLFRMCVARDLADFIHNFDILQYLVDFFMLLCLGFHMIGVSYIDFYIRVCFGIWIIAMKTNLEYRFAYLQRHQNRQRQQSREPPKAVSTTTGASSAEGGRETRDRARDHLEEQTDERLSMKSLDSHPSSTTTTRTQRTFSSSAHKPRLLSSCSSFTLRDSMPLADFKAKYKIDTLDEIQRNLNTMDDHLEVSREFQNSSLVLITLSAFLTNGALLLLAYNLLANQSNYFHGVVVILLAASYTFAVFLCYIGDSWILYALESFVQTVEDEYFLQSGGGGDGSSDADYGDGENEAPYWEPRPTRTQLLADDTISGREVRPGGGGGGGGGGERSLTPRPATAQEPSDAGSETAPTSRLATQQSYQLFMIKKRDVLFCREFLHQFQNHLATPWSKLTVKIQLHMLGTFVTLIAAQIIFDREH